MLKRPFKKTVKYSAEDLEIKEFLIGLAKEQYDHGDSFYAIKKLSGSWEFGSSNDEPMKFGNGYTNQLAGNMVKLLFDKYKNSLWKHKKIKPITINIDFDGTCVTHEFPNIGKSIGAEKVLKRLTNNGHQLILFTMRSDRTEAKPVIDPTIQNVTGKFLTDAVNWFKGNNIPLYGIQKNPTQFNWTTSPKSYAELMIDDSALGCPLRYDLQVSERPFVDWETVELYLENMGCFN